MSPGVLSSTYKIVFVTLLAAVTEYVARTGFGGRVYCGSQFGGPPILVGKAWSYTHGWADPIVFTVRKWGECMLVPSWIPPLFGGVLSLQGYDPHSWCAYFSVKPLWKDAPWQPRRVFPRWFQTPPS